MIDSLHIKNFQVFEDIEIKGLRRVNLIAGKNNSGKTAMLEALRILAADGNETVINNILLQRGQFKKSNPKSYQALFNRNHAARNGEDSNDIMINFISIKQPSRSQAPLHFEVESYDTSYHEVLYANSSAEDPIDGAVYIPFNSDRFKVEELWREIVLRPSEDDVINILRNTVEPRLKRLDMVAGTVLVRLENENEPVPISSLGEGVRRILVIALALVSAKNKMLLIDEFEAGLHHSVQKRLWEMVFEYAAKWDIQVFATTHSQDTVRNFYYVASRPEYENEATFLRLQFDRLGVHEAQVYDMERLGQSLELHLETR